MKIIIYILPAYPYMRVDSVHSVSKGPSVVEAIACRQLTKARPKEGMRKLFQTEDQIPFKAILRGHMTAVHGARGRGRRRNECKYYLGVVGLHLCTLTLFPVTSSVEVSCWGWLDPEEKWEEFRGLVLDDPGEGPSGMGKVKLGLQEGSEPGDATNSLEGGELDSGEGPSRRMSHHCDIGHPYPETSCCGATSGAFTC